MKKEEAETMETEAQATQGVKMRVVLPSEGFITLQDLAVYMDIRPGSLQATLEKAKVPILKFGKGYNHKLLRLEDLKSTTE